MSFHLLCGLMQTNKCSKALQDNPEAELSAVQTLVHFYFKDLHWFFWGLATANNAFIQVGWSNGKLRARKTLFIIFFQHFVAPIKQITNFTMLRNPQISAYFKGYLTVWGVKRVFQDNVTWVMMYTFTLKDNANALSMYFCSCALQIDCTSAIYLFIFYKWNKCSGHLLVRCALAGPVGSFTFCRTVKERLGFSVHVWECVTCGNS